MRVRTLADPLSVALAILFMVLSVSNGLRIGFRVMDADERVYRDTLVAMRDGDGYYDAMRDALVAKEGEPPSQVRAIRPPTTYLALHVFPVGSWRWLVGLVYLAVCLLAWRLARPLDELAGPTAVVLAGTWCLGFSYYVFLHAELWGLPFLLAGALAVRRERDGVAAGLLAIATIVRELYALPLVLGLLFARRRRPWIGAIAGVGVFYLAHYLLASSVVEAGGHEAAFGNEDLTGRFLLRVISPGVGGWEYAVGVATVVAGVVGLVAATAGRDRAARLLLPSTTVLAVAGVLATRVYWSAVWAVPMAVFAPAVFALLRRRPVSATATPKT